MWKKFNWSAWVGYVVIITYLYFSILIKDCGILFCFYLIVEYQEMRLVVEQQVSRNQVDYVQVAAFFSGAKYIDQVIFQA